MGASLTFSSSRSCCIKIESGRWENISKGWPLLPLLPESWANRRWFHRRPVYLSQTFTLVKKKKKNWVIWSFSLFSETLPPKSGPDILCAKATNLEVQLSVFLLSVLIKTCILPSRGNGNTWVCIFRYFPEFVNDHEGFLSVEWWVHVYYVTIIQIVTKITLFTAALNCA